MNPGIVVITLALLGCATYLTGIKVLPTEVMSAICGSLATAITVVIQRNTYQAAYHDAIKASVMPPPMKEGES